MKILNGKTIERIEMIDWYEPGDGFEEATIFFTDGTALDILANYNNDHREGYFNFMLRGSIQAQPNNATELPHLEPLMEGASSAAPKPVTSSAKLQSAD